MISLTADEKYSLRYSENFQQSIQMHLSKKQKTVSHFFVSFLKSTSSFSFFEKKDDAHSLCIFKITHLRRS